MQKWHQSPRIRGFVLGLLVLALGIAVNKVLSNQRKPPPKLPGLGRPLVQTLPVRYTNARLTLPITGRIKAVNRIEIYSEVQGIMLPNNGQFRAGKRFDKGAILLKIDDTEAKASLLAQRAAYINTLSQLIPDLRFDYPSDANLWQAYLESLDPQKPVSAPPTVNNAQLKLFLTARNLYTTYHNLRSSELRLEKYTIKAPFGGSLTDALLTEGELIRPQQKLGTFINSDQFEWEVAIGSELLPYLQTGLKAIINPQDGNSNTTAELIRVNSKIDESTQTIRVFFTLEGQSLKEGQFITGQLPTIELQKVFKVARRNLLNDRYVFALNDSVLSRLEPKIEAYNGDTAFVSELPEGIEILAEPLPGAYHGMLVKKAKP